MGRWGQFGEGITRVVEELVFNSLDAGATKVSVAIGIGTCFVKVDDNGCGVSRDGPVLMGEKYDILFAKCWTAINFSIVLMLLYIISFA
ncbi:DNA mismatch repair protein MLH3-like [Solanum dulcamara]|uniref:DNA mismatch repair protein MLH3-like n=1 Tax=Solanum dulcamara TaxID=45834 RepID=UPI002484FD03|nr:DNA mismatch repair protein MLH3-like [Solanum dulcamara]